VLVNRVVTGRDEKGNPAIIRRGTAPTVIHAGKYITTELWVNDPAKPLAAGEPSVSEWSLEPPPGGACFRIVEIASGDMDSAAQDTGGPGHSTFQDEHQTDTLDFVAVLQGEVTLVVGRSEVTLRPGDSVIQQPGIPHNWENRSAEPSVLVGVLISARTPRE
jgi:mannose-6-phosphate isomerase-like protein (cupin superfamily)